VSKIKLTKEQLFSYIKHKSGDINLDFNHDPAQNAGPVILKYGTGARSDDAGGKVQGGHVYWLDETTAVWTKAQWADEASMGAGNLLGLALGKFGTYEGTPETVGMLINGVATTAIFGTGPVGAPLWGSYNAAGRMASAPPSANGVRIFQKLGHALGYRLTPSGYVETIVSFTPSLEFATTSIGSGGGGGETNTASNVGAGDGLFKQKAGVDLEFKTLVEGSNITLTAGTDEVTIASTGGGGADCDDASCIMAQQMLGG